MNNAILVALYYLTLIFICPSLGGNEFQRVVIKSMRCNNASEKYIYKNVSCFARSFSRTVTTGNILLYLKKPLSNIHVIFQLFFKYGTIYREVLHTQRFDWCQVTNRSINTILINQILDLTVESVPDVVHSCPYKEFVMINGTFKLTSALAIFPRGDYKMNFFISDTKNQTIVVFASVGSVISSYIETFG